MAEGMNQMSQEQLMLVDGFESLVKALGTEIPIGLAEDLAAVRNGMPMTPEMQRILAEGSMRLGQQLKDQGGMPNMMNNTNPDIMKDPSMGAMSEGEMMGTYQVDDGEMQMTPSQMKSMQESGAITPDAGRVMSMDDAIAAGIVTPTRPQARPMMTSPRPQMRR